MSIQLALRPLAAFLALSAGPALAVSVEQIPFKYQITKGSSFSPIDVAVYSPIGTFASYANHSLFVVDAGANELLHYPLKSDGTLASTTPAVWFSDSSYTMRIRAVACDDNERSPNFGQVYFAVNDVSSGVALLFTKDILGNDRLCSSSTPNWNDIVALAVDRHGDVYVADRNLKLTDRIDASWFTPFVGPPYCNLPVPITSYVPFISRPADVTVTESDLVLVADDCGCLMASNRSGSDFFVRSSGVPALQRMSIDAHDESERLWVIDPPGAATSTKAERLFFKDCYANNGTVRPLDGETVSTGPGLMTGPSRVEYGRFFDSVKLGSSIYPRCSERVFVADPAANRVTCHATSQTTVTSPTNAAAHWRFDDTSGLILDSSGNGNDGYFAWSVAPVHEEGMAKTGLGFADSNDGVKVPTAATLNVGTGSFTWDCWVRTCDTRAVRNIVDKRQMSGASAVKGYAMYLYNGYLSFQIAANSTWWNIGTASNPAGFVADGLYHHVAVIVDRDFASATQDTIAFYVDGQIVGTPIAIPTSVLGNLSNGHPLLIARHPYSGETQSLAGEIDELALYKRTLTPAMISAIYNARGAGKR